MRRLKDTFIDALETVVPLAGLNVIEIGCGDGTRSVELAARVGKLTGVDPDPAHIASAQARRLSTAVFYRSRAECLLCGNDEFDMSIFTLSFHHVPSALLNDAIAEAVRVTRHGGHIVFLEPGTRGSFYETEILFDASDGDEREAKAAAYAAMLAHPLLYPVAELPDETVFAFEDLDDFMVTMTPARIDGLKWLLEQYGFVLNAERRINIYQPFK